MVFFKRFFSIFLIILSFLSVNTKDSDISLIKSSESTPKTESIFNSLDSKELVVKSKSNSNHSLLSIQRSRNIGVGTGDDLFKDFWHSLFVDRTAFNSSFALNVPLFTLTVPGYGRGLNYETPLSALNVGNLAMVGILVLSTIALTMPILFPEEIASKRSFDDDIKTIPYILAKRIINISEAFIGRSMNNEERQGLSNFMTSRLVGVSESIMGWVEKSVDDLPNFPRLDAQECMKRCICEAHNQPKKYGLTGLVLQLFFPPYTEAEEPLKVVSKYQLAARYGRQDNANCAAQYDGCLVNFLDIVQGLINLVF